MRGAELVTVVDYSALNNSTIALADNIGMGGLYSKKSLKSQRTKQGRAISDSTEQEADDNLCALQNASNTLSPALHNEYRGDIVISESIPKTNYFVMGSGGIKDRDILVIVGRIAREMGPQPFGHIADILGVTVLWCEKPCEEDSSTRQRRDANPEGTEISCNGKHLGGDPPRPRSTPLEKVAAPQGYHPPVRALYPQLPPPAEPRA